MPQFAGPAPSAAGICFASQEISIYYYENHPAYFYHCGSVDPCYLADGLRVEKGGGYLNN